MGKVRLITPRTPDVLAITEQFTPGEAFQQEPGTPYNQANDDVWVVDAANLACSSLKKESIEPLAGVPGNIQLIP
jgi:hypothetical protein